MSTKSKKSRPAKKAQRSAPKKKPAAKKKVKTAPHRTAARKPAAKKAAAKKAAPKKPAPRKPVARPQAAKAPIKTAVVKPAVTKPAAARNGQSARNQPPPPSRPVPSKEVDRFRKALDIKKASIVHSFNEYRERSQGLGDDGTQDIGDQATNSYNKEFFLSLSEEHRNQIQAIDEAIRRIDRGVYGICAACGDEIDMPRLNAVPWSTLCLKCQESMDQER
jgi:DnaK suppressor protein